MTIELNSFAAACYDMNGVEDLKHSLELGPDATDMREWGLTAEEWREQIELAIEALEADE